MERTEGGERMILGANYWPAGKGVSWWREFELSPVKRDFSLAAEYGLDLVGVFCSGRIFSPKSTGSR